MGIGKPAIQSQISGYVLSDFSPAEAPHLKEWIATAAEAAQALVKEPLAQVQSLYSRKGQRA